MAIEFSDDAPPPRPARHLWWVGGAALFLLLALVLSIALFRPGFAVARLQQLIAERTDLHLDSLKSARIRLFPHPALVVEDLRLASPGPSPYFSVHATQALVPMSWSALLLRRIEPQQVVLTDTLFEIAVNRQAQAMAVPEASPANSSGEDKAGEAQIGAQPFTITVTDGRLHFIDAERAQRFTIGQANVGVDISQQGGADLKGTAVIDSQFMRLSTHIQSLARLRRDGSPFDLSLEGPELASNFAGRLSLTGGLGLVGTFSLKMDEAGPLARWLGVTEGAAWLKTLRGLEAEGPVDALGLNFVSKAVTVKLGGTTAKGHLSLDLGQTPKRVAGQLNIDAVKLPASLLQTGTVGQAGVHGAPQTWMMAPLPHTLWPDFAADLKLSCYRIEVGDLKLGPLDIGVLLAAQRLDITAKAAGVMGGVVDTALHFDASATPLTAALSFTGSGLRWGEPGSSGSGSALQGAGDASFQVTAIGGTLEDMTGTLAGKAALNLPQLTLNGQDLRSSIAAAAHGGQQGWMHSAGAKTEVTGLTGSFAIRDGIASTNDGMAALDGVGIKIKGDVDLLRRAVDMVLTPTPSLQSLLGIRVHGPWDNPLLQEDTQAKSAPAPQVEVAPGKGSKPPGAD